MTVIAVVGSRDFDDDILLHQVLDTAISYRLPDVQLISGGSIGADALVEEYAEFNGIPFREYSGNAAHGRFAAYGKLLDMANACDECIAFWNGESQGTAKFINLCREYHIPIRVVPFESKAQRYSALTGRDRECVCSV